MLSKDIPILIDMDDTICATSQRVMEIYAMEHYCEIPTEWDWFYTNIKDVRGMYWQQIFNRRGFFRDLEPIDGAWEAVNKLFRAGYQIYFVTRPVYNEWSYREKIDWLYEMFNWFDPDEHFIATNAKHMVKGLLIDDNVEHLKRHPDITICFTQPHNKDVTCADLRANSWEGIVNYILGGGE